MSIELNISLMGAFHKCTARAVDSQERHPSGQNFAFLHIFHHHQLGSFYSYLTVQDRGIISTRHVSREKSFLKVYSMWK